MLSVPVLVTLTDRVDAELVYLFGVGCTIIGHLLFGLPVPMLAALAAFVLIRPRELAGDKGADA